MVIVGQPEWPSPSASAYAAGPAPLSCESPIPLAGGPFRAENGAWLLAVRVYLEADAPRVSCAEHGVVVAAVPWARHGSRFTTAFEDTAAWLACHAALTVLAVLLRITWRSVSAIVIRVVAEAAGKRDRLAGLRRIGIDEISYRKGQRYLLCVVNHDTGRLVWAGKNRQDKTKQSK